VGDLADLGVEGDLEEDEPIDRSPRLYIIVLEDVEDEGNASSFGRAHGSVDVSAPSKNKPYTYFLK
jgi:hypothetical protein